MDKIIMNYTHQDWKEFKKEFSLSNKDIGEIIGMAETSIENQCAPAKTLPKWAKAFIYSWKKTNELLISKK